MISNDRLRRRLEWRHLSRCPKGKILVGATSFFFSFFYARSEKKEEEVDCNWQLAQRINWEFLSNPRHLGDAYISWHQSVLSLSGFIHTGQRDRTGLGLSGPLFGSNPSLCRVSGFGQKAVRLRLRLRRRRQSTGNKSPKVATEIYVQQIRIAKSVIRINFHWKMSAGSKSQVKQKNWWETQFKL